MLKELSKVLMICVCLLYGIDYASTKIVNQLKAQEHVETLILNKLEQIHYNQQSIFSLEYQQIQILNAILNKNPNVKLFVKFPEEEKTVFPWFNKGVK